MEHEQHEAFKDIVYRIEKLDKRFGDIERDIKKILEQLYETDRQVDTIEQDARSIKREMK